MLQNPTQLKDIVYYSLNFFVNKTISKKNIQSTVSHNFRTVIFNIFESCCDIFSALKTNNQKNELS